jgi:hypothetical protein
MALFGCALLLKAFEVVLGFLRHMLHRSEMIERFCLVTDFNVFETAQVLYQITHVGRFLYSDQADDARFKQNPYFNSEYSKWPRTLGITMMSSMS